ncbi:hypothetical protein FACS189465_3510 [Clostridia bacterium]|nr:hypothetical protein FACS189465_3510 [Clostridia bacterium]
MPNKILSDKYYLDGENITQEEAEALTALYNNLKESGLEGNELSKAYLLARQFALKLKEAAERKAEEYSKRCTALSKENASLRNEILNFKKNESQNFKIELSKEW